MTNRKKFWIITALIPILLIVGLLSLALFQKHQHLQARRDWKEEAIAVIHHFANDHDWVRTEIAQPIFPQNLSAPTFAAILLISEIENERWENPCENRYGNKKHLARTAAMMLSIP
jgi:hypothetical protein